MAASAGQKRQKKKKERKGGETEPMKKPLMKKDLSSSTP